jgi:hypothetical protein
VNWKIFSLKSPGQFYQDNLSQLQEQIVSNLPEIKKITQQLALAIPIGFLSLYRKDYRRLDYAINFV